MKWQLNVPRSNQLTCKVSGKRSTKVYMTGSRLAIRTIFVGLQVNAWSWIPLIDLLVMQSWKAPKFESESIFSLTSNSIRTPQSKNLQNSKTSAFLRRSKLPLVVTILSKSRIDFHVVTTTQRTRKIIGQCHLENVIKWRLSERKHRRAVYHYPSWTATCLNSSALQVLRDQYWWRCILLRMSAKTTWVCYRKTGLLSQRRKLCWDDSN